MMATTAISAQPNSSKYYMNPSAGPSPPEAFNCTGRPATTPPSQNISQNVSPTNYHANVRQLRQPRQPLYVPAALRPNEKIARPTDIPARPRAPDTPPASNESSFDAGRLDSSAATDFARFQLGGPSESDHESLRRGLSRAASEIISLEEMGPVTGTPTTAHWKPDESAKSCYVCKETFGWIFRRHHCRRCGNVVCYNHVRSVIPLDQNARIHPDGHPSKACDPCHDEYKIVKKLYHSRASSISESTNSSQGTAMPIPGQMRKTEDVRIGSMARSEGGMVWSTF
ncbi:E3 ubiquitin-protein ligase PIB1 [Cercospora zeina]